MADDVVIRLSATGAGRVRADVLGVSGAIDTLGSSAAKSAAQADTALGRLDQRLQNLSRGQAGQGLKQLGNQLTLFATLPVGAGLVAAEQQASHLNEVLDFTSRVFGDATGAMTKFGDESLDKLGLARVTALDAANGFGVLLKQVTKSPGELSGLSQRLVKLGVDITSAKDPAGGLEQSLNAIQSALQGEIRPLREFGIFVSDAAVQQFALSHGIASSKGELTDQQKIVARLGLIFQQSAQFNDNYADTQDQAANKTRKAAEASKQMAADLGTALLPVAKTAAGVVITLAGAFERLPEGAQTAVIAVGGLVALGGPLIRLAGSVVALRAGFAQMAVAQQLTTAATVESTQAMNSAAAVSSLYAAETKTVGLSLSSLAGPIGIAVAAIGALGFALSQNGHSFDDFVQHASSATTEQLVGAFDKLRGFFGEGPLKDLFRDIADQSEGTARRIIAGMKAAGQDTTAFEKILNDVAAGHRRAAQDAAAQTGATSDLDALLKNLNTTFSDGADAMDEWADSLPLNKVMDAAAASRSYADETAKLREMVAKNAEDEKARAKAVDDATRQVADAKSRLADAESKYQEALAGATDLERDRLRVSLEQARVSAGQARMDLDAAKDHLSRLSAGASPKQRAEAAQAVAAAQANLDDANTRVGESQKALDDATPGSVGYQKRLAEAADGVRDAQRDVRDATDKMAEAQRNAKPSAEELAQRQRDLADQMDRVVKAAATDISLNFDQPQQATQELYNRLKALADLFPQLQPLINTFLQSTDVPLQNFKVKGGGVVADDGGVFAGPTLVQIGRRVGQEAWIPRDSVSRERAGGLLSTAAAWHGYRVVRMDDGGILGAGGRQFAQAQVVVVKQQTTVEEYNGPVIANGLTLEEVRREQRADGRVKSLSRGSRGRR